MTQASESRLGDLLADRATGDLGGESRLELQGLLAAHAGGDDDSFDLAAAAIDLVFLDTTEPLPRYLYDRVLGRFDEQQASRISQPMASVTPFPDRPPSADSWRWIGWWVAAAALILAAVGWLGGNTNAVDPAPLPSTLAELRASLMNQPDRLEKVWTATEDPDAAGASGDVIWHTELQQGYMRFAGLPVNDPSVTQYQLWIFDDTQDERYPIDGGVFDIESSGEVVIPIDAKIQVRQPKLFAITIEKSGGVVVSSRERIVLIASLS